LEFKVPFQHKYGYIRDEGLLGGLRSASEQDSVMEFGR